MEGWRDPAIDRPPTPRVCAPVACALFGGHDYDVRMIMGSLCQSAVYFLGGRRRFLFLFFARLPIIVHEQRPPSFSTPLLVRRAFLVARSREREREREGEAASGLETRRYEIAFFAPKCLVLSR